MRWFDAKDSGLGCGFDALVLTNAMKPMRKLPAPLLALREAYGARLTIRALDVAVDAFDPVHTVIFPEMDAGRDVPEITEACWGVLHKSPDDVMCASSRMVVNRKGAAHPTGLPCTLLAYDPQFELGRTLVGATRAVSLNHPHCASFCVLGGAACSR